MCNVCKHYSKLILCDSQELTRVRWVPTNYVRESENCTYENETRAGQRPSLSYLKSYLLGHFTFGMLFDMREGIDLLNSESIF